MLSHHRSARLLFSAMLAIFLWTPAYAQTPDAEGLAERLRDGIEAAVVAGDNEALEAMRALAERALTAHPEDALLHHYMGYALYRMGIVGFDTDPMGAVSTLAQAQTHLEVSIDIEPIAESHALMTSVLGAQITSDASAMQMGMQISTHMYQATAMGPDNPRVALMEGLNAYHTPAMWGGGYDQALEHILRAIELFEADAPPSPLPAWGHAEAYAWLGQTYEALADRGSAREAYEKGLEVAPGYTWISESLLPAVKR